MATKLLFQSAQQGLCVIKGAVFWGVLEGLTPGVQFAVRSNFELVGTCKIL